MRFRPPGKPEITDEKLVAAAKTVAEHLGLQVVWDHGEPTVVDKVTKLSIEPDSLKEGAVFDRLMTLIGESFARPGLLPQPGELVLYYRPSLGPVTVQALGGDTRHPDLWWCLLPEWCRGQKPVELIKLEQLERRPGEIVCADNPFEDSDDWGE